MRASAVSILKLTRDGALTLEEILEDPPDAIGRMRVFDVLRRAHWMSDEGADRLLRRARVWPLMTVDDLGTEQRRQLISELPPRARRPRA